MGGKRTYFPIVGARVKPRQFQSLFLFVTSRCNSLCRTCFYFDKLNSKDDLTFDQIRRLSETAPPFKKLWISGGEPFLRDELAEIVTLFVRNNGVRNINLPTNGLLQDRTIRTVEAILEANPELDVDLNFSLDGLANTHDAIRGVPNNFERSLATLAAVESRFKGVRRLRRNVVTVITSENYREIMQLAGDIYGQGKADGHYFEVVRGQTPDPALKILNREDVTELHRRLFAYHRAYARKLFGHLPFFARKIATMYYLGNIRLHFDLHERCLDQPERWPMPCTAGETSIVIDHNGVFRACELRDAVGTLADFDYDVTEALKSEAMRSEVQSIPGANCWCTHSCFIQDSSKFSSKVQLFSIPWAWFKQRSESGQTIGLDSVDGFKSLEVN
jgi:Fe-coproporphyrin III synthase